MIGADRALADLFGEGIESLHSGLTIEPRRTFPNVGSDLSPPEVFCSSLYQMSDLDPYQTPESSLSDVVHEPTLRETIEGWPLASRWQRLAAALIDALLMGVAAMIFFVPLFIFSSAVRVEGMADVLGTMVVSVAFLAMNSYWMAKDGQTLGKKALGIYMVNYETNRLVPLGDLILKRYLPFWALGLIPILGGIVNLVNVLFIFGLEKRCLHDLTAGTSRHWGMRQRRPRRRDRPSGNRPDR